VESHRAGLPIWLGVLALGVGASCLLYRVDEASKT